MKDSYVLRLPLENGFFNNEFALSDKDIKSLKDLAKKDGRSLRVYIANKLKIIAKENPTYILG